MPRRATLTPFWYLLAEAGLLLIFAYLLLLAGSSNGVINYDLTRFSLGLITVLAVAWSVGAGLQLWGGGALVLPLARPLALFLMVYLLTAFTSIDPRRSLGDFWLMLGYACAFMVTANLVAWGWPRELFVKTTLIVGGVLLGLGWYSVWTWYQAWLASAPGQWLPTVIYRLPAANTLAIFWYMLLLMAVARLGAMRGRLARGLVALWSVAALGMIFFTSSRGGWVGTAAGLMTLAALGLWRAQWLARWRRGWQQGAWRSWRVGVLAGVAVLAVGGLAWLVYRQWNHPSHQGGLLTSRDYLWQPAWQAFVASPLVGQGPFTFGSLYMRFNAVPPSPLYIHAHSVYFNFLAETGLLGITALAILAVTAGLALWRQLRRLDGYDWAVAAGALGVAAALAVHGLVESVNIEPSNSLLVAILLGAALAPRPAEEAHLGARLPGRGWPALAGVAALLVAGWYGLWLSTPLHWGVVAANQSRWAEAASNLQEAARRDSRSALVYQQWGLAESVLAKNGEAGALDQAVAAFEQATRLDADWPLNHANLGALYAAAGNPAAALTQMREASRRNPQASLYLLNLGQTAEAAGSADEARRAYADALKIEAEPAYFWRSTPLRAAAWAARPPATHSVLNVGDVVHTEVAAGQIQTAERLVSDTALEAAATDLEVGWARAELAAGHQDFAAAAAQGQGLVNRYLGQSVYGPGKFGDPSYGPFLFRREAMALDLVPQLMQVPVPDRWAERMVRLGDWYTAAGQATQAAGAYRAVLHYVPDNTTAQQRLAGVK